MSDTLQKIYLVAQAELTYLKIQLRAFCRQVVLGSMALLLSMLTVAMANVAAYFALAQRFNPPIAAALVAAVNGLLAVGLFVALARIKPGPELPLAQELRDLARSTLKQDVDRLLENVNEIKADLQRIRSGVAGTATGSPLTGIAHILPLIDLLISHFRRPKR
jgi:hypothetical protein